MEEQQQTQRELQNYWVKGHPSPLDALIRLQLKKRNKTKKQTPQTCVDIYLSKIAFCLQLYLHMNKHSCVLFYRFVGSFGGGSVNIQI